MKTYGIIPLLAFLAQGYIRANPIPPKKTVQEIIQKHGLEKIDSILKINSIITAGKHETISLCYQTLLFINAQKTLKKQIPIQNFEDKLISAITEIVNLKNPKKSQSYQARIQKILLLNENPSIIYQLEEKLKLTHASWQHKPTPEKDTPSTK